MSTVNPYPVDSTTRECCGGIGGHTADCNEVFHIYGHHTVWCTTESPEDDHDDRWPWCDRLIGGAEGVSEPGWQRTQIWASTIAAFTRGVVTREGWAAEERNRRGVQLTFSTLTNDDGRNSWVDSSITNLSSGEARRLAAILVAAADLSDGLTLHQWGQR